MFKHKKAVGVGLKKFLIFIEINKLFVYNTTMGIKLDRDLPSNDALDNSMAFKGNSAQILQSALEEVQKITQGGQDVFSPGFPTYSTPESGTALKTEPRSGFQGLLKKSEAVAEKVLLDETSAFYQNFAKNDQTARKIDEALQLPKGGWQMDATDGITEYGLYVGIAAGVREEMRKGEKPAKGRRSIGDVVKADWRKKFEEPLKADGLNIGRNTSRAIKDSIAELAERDIPNNPEGAKTPEEIQARIQSKKHGAQMAEKLFFEVKDIASKVFGE